MMFTAKRVDLPLGGMSKYRGSDGREYHRFKAGVGWPYRGKAGYVVVLAEDEDEDEEYGVRALRVVEGAAMFGGRDFMEVEPMVEYMVQLSTRLGYPEIVAPPGEPWLRLGNVLQGLVALRKRRPRVSMAPLWEEGGIEYYAAQTRRRMRTEKTLHIGDSPVQAEILSLPVDLKDFNVQQKPGATALLCALVAMDGSMAGGGRRKQGGAFRPADSVGY